MADGSMEIDVRMCCSECGRFSECFVTRAAFGESPCPLVPDAVFPGPHDISAFEDAAPDRVLR